jgi:hypothetical protein
MMPFRFLMQDLASTPGPVILVNSVLVVTFATIFPAEMFSFYLRPTAAVSIAALIATFFCTVSKVVGYGAAKPVRILGSASPHRNLPRPAEPDRG